MTFLNYIDLNLSQFLIILFIVFVASIIRGFNGFGFSATCMSLISFILPAIEIVPIILVLEVMVSIFMFPYIWNNIDWKFVFQILIGISIGSPIGLYLLKILSPDIVHLSICGIIIFFVILQLKGYSNQKINILPVKFLAGGVSGIINGLGTLGGMPISLFLLITKVRPIVIRGSLAAIFFIADAYVLNLSFYAEIVEPTALYRVLPLILVLPIGIYIGNKFFVKSREETYRKFVFYFLILISIFGIAKVLMNF
ncbi:sulfite exporter TauE/SafE family protein [Candidatus Pelagibacter sp.]|nr:sulfite exporter TauE/SafE family protein [Candidatus Pelagibacter sp.]